MQERETKGTIRFLLEGKDEDDTREKEGCLRKRKKEERWIEEMRERE